MIEASTESSRLLLQAASEGNISSLTEVTRADIQQVRCKSGCSVLHWAAGSNQVETLATLLSLEKDNNGGSLVDLLATGKSRGRTPLHYACRNGCLEAAQYLLQRGAHPHAKAKHGVTPFQLAVWRNQLAICQWLVEECGVVAAKDFNDFGCGAVHWLGIAAVEQSTSLLPLAAWLAEQPEIDFTVQQKQGHTVLHKAAWLGHLELCRYLHETHDMWDDLPDLAGNYAADLAEMHRPAHLDVADYLRRHCSRQRAVSCAVLGLDVSNQQNLPQGLIRKAYLHQCKRVHPDQGGTLEEFEAVHAAYRHLLGGGMGTQSNPAHSLKLLLPPSTTNSKRSTEDATDSCNLSTNVQEGEQDDDCFAARLTVVLKEFGDKGIDLSNLRKKWHQVWPDTPWPGPDRKFRVWLSARWRHVVRLESDNHGAVRVHIRK